MSNQIAVSNTQAVTQSFTQEELNTLKHTIANGTTNEQFSLFVQTCQASGLNPFLNQIYCIVYGGKMSLQVSVEGVLALARRQPDYRGVDVELVHENDEFKYNASSKEITHSAGFPRGKVIGGYAIAKREGFQDVVTLMETTEVEHMTKGTNKNMWGNYFNDMFKKHIIKRAAKLQFGIEISEDDIVTNPVAETPSYEPGPRKDITPEQIVIGEGEVIDPGEELKILWDKVGQQTSDLGMGKDELKVLIKEKFNAGAKELSLQQVIGLSKVLANQKPKEENLGMDFDEMNFDD